MLLFKRSLRMLPFKVVNKKRLIEVVTEDATL